MSDKPNWYPDWSGETAIVVASGPSAVEQPLDVGRGIQGVHFLAIKSSIELCRWADVLHAADYLWWSQVNGYPDFDGIRTTLNRRASLQSWNVNLVRCGVGTNRMEFDDLGKVGWGGNSGFGAVNLAAQLGASKIVLVGFDMRIDLGIRWHPDHGGQSANPDIRTVERWRTYLDAAAPELARRGIKVINASKNSALKAFERMSFWESLRLS